MAETSQNSTAFDAGRQYLGTVYAKALLGAAEKAGNTGDVLEELESLVTDVFGKSPNLEAALASPRIGHDEKVRLLDRVFQGRMSKQLLNFLKVVSSHGRLDCLRAINRAALKLYNKMRNRVEVSVRTAEPVDAQLTEQIANRLRTVLRSDVELKTDVDPELIGGMVIRIGDTVYDGSVVDRLRRLRAETIEKTAQEFRQSLERFAVAE
jgi:F-type H+-transporting ATPase subunit delta